jgi:hypothetical protein
MTKLLDITVVPAEKGYKLFTIEVDASFTHDTVPAIWMEDIIGWRVETYRRENGEVYSFTDAVTISGSYAHNYYIIRPNGFVDEPHGVTFPDTAALIKHLREKSDGPNA